MRVSIRIYKRHDIDLLGIRCELGRKMPSFIKSAMCSYVSGIETKISYPDVAWESLDSMPSHYLIQLSLNPNNSVEKPVCDFIKSIPPGFRNSVIKHITRQHIAQIKEIQISGNKLYLAAAQPSIFHSETNTNSQ